MKFEIGKYTISKHDNLNWAVHEKRKVDANHPFALKNAKATSKTRHKSILVGLYNSLLTAKQELAEYMALNDCKNYKELCKWINKIKDIK